MPENFDPMQMLSQQIRDLDLKVDGAIGEIHTVKTSLASLEARVETALKLNWQWVVLSVGVAMMLIGFWIGKK